MEIAVTGMTIPEGPDGCRQANRYAGGDARLSPMTPLPECHATVFPCAYMML
jgi:hypothetical protein